MHILSDLSSFFNETYIDLTESSDEIVTAQNGSTVLLRCTIVNRIEDSIVVWMRTTKGRDPRSKYKKKVTINDQNKMKLVLYTFFSLQPHPRHVIIPNNK